MSTSSLSSPVSSNSSGADAGLTAALRSVCVVRLSATGWIRVTGEDRVRWLNGMVTNSIRALQPGDGCMNFLLSAQGRIQGTAVAWAEAEAILLQTDATQVASVMALLDRFIIMDDVELADVSAAWSGAAVLGPGAKAMMRGVGMETAGLPESGFGFAEAGGTLRVQAVAGKVVPRYEIWGAEDAVNAKVEALRAAGAVEGEAASLEMLRLLEGRPRFGVDIREKELAQETGQTEALHFNKGCYVGQEIVERVRSRGNVHRGFVGFALDGVLPVEGTVLVAGGKTVGELTSVAELPAVPGVMDGGAMALGYLRREAADGGQEIGYEGGVARLRAIPLVLDDDGAGS